MPGKMSDPDTIPVKIGGSRTRCRKIYAMLGHDAKEDEENPDTCPMMKKIMKTGFDSRKDK